MEHARFPGDYHYRARNLGKSVVLSGDFKGRIMVDFDEGTNEEQQVVIAKMLLN
jgi:hypothetical protein